MKRIYIVRHGKAEEGIGKADFERNLIAKGERKTKKIANYLANKKVKVDWVLASMAHRTKQTAHIIIEELSIGETKFQEEKALYLASVNSILEVIYGVSDSIEDLLLVGHNPGVSSLATYLSNEDIDWMPTSAVVALELKTDKWHEIPQAKSKLMFYTIPADL